MLANLLIIYYDKLHFKLQHTQSSLFNYSAFLRHDINNAKHQQTHSRDEEKETHEIIKEMLRQPVKHRSDDITPNVKSIPNYKIKGVIISIKIAYVWMRYDIVGRKN